MNKIFFFTILGILAVSFLYTQNAYAVTVYPGTFIGNAKTNYTADVHPNFNVTQFNVTTNHIFFGNKYFDLNSTSGQVNANITKFVENNNMTLKLTSSFGNVHLFVYGQLKQVQLGTTFYPYGSNWQYVLGNTVTDVIVGAQHDVFISFNNTSGPITVSSFTMTGYVLGLNGHLSQPLITLSNPVNANLTEIGIFDDTSLVFDQVYSVPIPLTKGSTVPININFTDTGRTGTVHYTAAALLKSGNDTAIVYSNIVPLFYGSFTPTQLNINQTNPLSVSFRFVRTDLNSTDTNLDVYYPFTFNSTCKLSYEISITDHTYHNLPASHATFVFHNLSNDVVTVNCKDESSTATGNYILTQAGFPLLQQIKDFRAGHFGTSGMFGAFDLITLLVLILSILGFNRINESVGVIVNVALIGALAFLGIIQWPVILSASVALVLVLVVTSTRKSQGF